MGFSFVRKAGNNGTINGSPGTINVVLGAAPAQHSIVVVAFALGSTGGTLTGVKDSNNNVYTITSGSPSTFQSGAGQIWLAYLLDAPSNATATITGTFTGAQGFGAASWAVNFTVSGGTIAFDKDAKNNSSTGTTINTPSITPTKANSLLYAACAVGGTVSTANSPWTLGTVETGDADAYDLSAPASATTVNWTQSGGAGWSAMSMAISFTPNPATKTQVGII